MLEEVVVTSGRVAQAECFDGGIVQSAFFAQIIENIVVRKKMTAIINDRVFQQLAEVFVRFFLLRRLTLIFLDLHARARGEFLQSLFEVQPFALHHKLEDVAAFVALTEASPRPRLGPDDEGRRMFVVVEGTEARVILPRVAQFDARLGDEVNDVYFGFDFVNGGHGLGRQVDR